MTCVIDYFAFLWFLMFEIKNGIEIYKSKKKSRLSLKFALPLLKKESW